MEEGTKTPALDFFSFGPLDAVPVEPDKRPFLCNVHSSGATTSPDLSRSLCTSGAFFFAPLSAYLCGPVDCLVPFQVCSKFLPKETLGA